MEGAFIEAQDADTWQYAIAYNPFDAEPVETWLDSEGAGWDTERALTVPEVNATGDTRAMTLHARTAFGTDEADAMHLTRLVEDACRSPVLRSPKRWWTSVRPRCSSGPWATGSKCWWA